VNIRLFYSSKIAFFNYTNVIWLVLVAHPTKTAQLALLADIPARVQKRVQRLAGGQN